jgi:hypothetical protein
MSNQKPTAQLPPSEWSALHSTITQTIAQLEHRKRNAFTVRILLHESGPQPYIQGELLEGGKVRIEFSSNVFLETELDAKQTSSLCSLGWSTPNGENPNYSKSFAFGYPKTSIALYLLTSIRIVLNPPLKTWFDFGATTPDLEVTSTSNLWHKINSPGVVCLPGQNKTETIEGIS